MDSELVQQDPRPIVTIPTVILYLPLVQYIHFIFCREVTAKRITKVNPVIFIVTNQP